MGEERAAGVEAVHIYYAQLTPHDAKALVEATLPIAKDSQIISCICRILLPFRPEMH
jgi:hypothetical protein